MPNTTFIAVCVAAVLVLAGCSSSATPEATDTPAPEATTTTTAWPVDITTAELTPVDFPAPALGGDERILALAVGSGEVVELLGAGELLVGRDETSSIAGDAPIVTQGHQIDMERALALTPTIVLVDELSGPPEAIEALANRGASIVQVPSVWTLADIDDRVRAIAEGIGVDNAVADQLANQLTPTAITNQTRPRVAFLYLRGPSAVYLLGGQSSGADALIEAAGGIDVGAELGYDGFVPLTAEAIAQADPEVFLVMSDGLDSVGGVDGLLSLPGIAQTKAGREQRIVSVDDRVLLSFGSRTPSLIDKLAQVFTQVNA